MTIEYLSPVCGVPFPVEFYEIGEDRHFWMQWRLAVALRLSRRAGWHWTARCGRSTSAGARAASGISSSGPPQWRVDMTDLNLPALRMARPARGRTLYYDVTQADPSLLGSYDAAFVFDVIEHLESPGPLLRAAVAHLRPGGHLLLNVPALQALYSAYDVVQGTSAATRGARSRRKFEVSRAGWDRPVLGFQPGAAARAAAAAGGAHPDREPIRSGFEPPNRSPTMRSAH